MHLEKNTHAPALVLEKKGELPLRYMPVRVEPAAGKVAVGVEVVGICGSDGHYYTHGRIGLFVVEAPMILGHEAAGRVVAIGPEVEGFKIGDRVCMEPGIPDPTSRASKLGIYSVDPSVTFWATPPVHGCLTPRVVHKAAFTYKLPDTVSFVDGAMVEPLAISLQAAARAQIKPGDTALVTGAGPIGILTALSALAGGAATVFVSDVVPDKLTIAAQYRGIVPVDETKEDVVARIAKDTAGWGVIRFLNVLVRLLCLGRLRNVRLPAVESLWLACFRGQSRLTLLSGKRAS